METNFLVVDFDYFFENPMDGGDFKGSKHHHLPLYDWSKKETPFYVNTIWAARILGFIMAGLELPRATEPYGGWEAWWDRFEIEPDVPLLICDSNAHAGLERDPEDGTAFDSVWLYDAHHDSGYTTDAWPPDDAFSCEDWMLEHAVAGTSPDHLHVRYPTWRIHAFGEPEPPIFIDREFDDGSSPPVKFHTVLACRSGAWVPPWCDDQFAALVEAYPGPTEQVDDVNLVREFDTEAAKTQAAFLHDQLDALKE